jgi:hypothetical protein
MEVLYSWFSFTVNKKLYLWKKEQKKNENQKKEEVGEASARPITPKVSQSRLKELAWTLDTRESLYEREGEWH